MKSIKAGIAAIWLMLVALFLQQSDFAPDKHKGLVFLGISVCVFVYFWDKKVDE